MGKLIFIDCELREVIAELLAKEDPKLQATWAADIALKVLPYFEEKYPGDNRPRKAIAACRAWVRGKIRVSEARKAALAAHAAARIATEDNNLPACMAARAAGHAVATAHVPRHSTGAGYYAAKVKFYAASPEKALSAIAKERKRQLKHLLKLRQKP
jgi:hypothetical protein